MTIPNKCKDQTTRKLIKVSESGRSLTVLNPRERSVCLITVDGCAITSGERCDFLYTSAEKELFVELKGSDIKKAVSQIMQSIAQLSSTDKARRTAAIVSSRVPAEDTGTMNAKAKLIKDFVSRLYIKNSSLEVDADLVL